MKKVLSVLLAVCLLLGALPMSAAASSEDFEIQGGVLKNYKGPGGDVVIPDGVTKIGGNAFDSCGNLISVKIPSSVKIIEVHAFAHCEGLQRVEIANGLTTIGYQSFLGCTRLRSINIPSSVTSILSAAFMNCRSLTYIAIPSGVTEIEDFTFCDCGLTSVTLPASISKIAEAAFSINSKLIDVFYAGTEDQWKKINIDNKRAGNAALLNAEIHYNNEGTVNPTPTPDEKDDLIDPTTGKLYAPKNLKWGEYFIYREHGNETWEAVSRPLTGSMAWEVEKPGNFLFKVRLYSKTTGKLISVKTGWGSNRSTKVAEPSLPAQGGHINSVDGENSFFEFENLPDGDYYFTVQTVQGTYSESDIDSEIAVSDIWTYKKPAAQLERIPKTDLNWEKNYAVFGPQTETAYFGGYSVQVAFSDDLDGSISGIRTSGDFAPGSTYYWNHALVKNGLYDEPGRPVSYRVKRISQDVNKYQNSEWSEWSEPYYWDGTEAEEPFLPEGYEPPYLPTPTPAPNVGGFDDVRENHWFASHVMWAVQNGITSGKGSTSTFKPNDTCTRAEIMTFLWAAEGRPTVSSTAAFSDMPTLAAFRSAISWAVEKGVTGGIGGGRFGTTAPCTRVQAVTFLWAAAGKPQPSTPAMFSDMTGNQIYDSAISWAVENQITSGAGNNRFDPNKRCTRAEIVTFLHKAYQ